MNKPRVRAFRRAFRLALLPMALGLLAPVAGMAQRRAAGEPPRRNIIFILADDHRHDFMAFTGGAPPFLRTPGLDRLAKGGAHVRNAFVTTSLCSPSRASILTGLYAHRHGVVDNSSPIPRGTSFFPERLQRAGYRTAYVGKWHMGEDSESDRPRPGFDHWISFRGQGVYVDPLLNVDGARREVKGYTTDVLTDLALAWLERHRRREPGRPFFLYLAHKAVHAEFVPAQRHAGRYAAEPIPYPETMALTEANYREKPRWVYEQRFGWHGVDFAYHGAMRFDDFYRRYAETLLPMDESVGRVLDFVEKAGLGDSTLIVYMSDNGFMLGEHGLIDKRNAYEESIRVPMIAWAPGLIPAGSTVTSLVRNIDVAPTLLAAAGVRPAPRMDGRDVLGLLRGGGAGEAPAEFLYEYYWEFAFPHTPTTFALRNDRYKFIFYHGVWDLSELYDLRADPRERNNLVNVPALQDTVRAMRARLFDRLERSAGMQVPMRRGEWAQDQRKPHPPPP